MKKYYLIGLLLLSFLIPSKTEAQNGYILLNEYLPWPNLACGNRSEFVELLNFGPGPVNIGCYKITDGDFSITIPPNTYVQPGEYYVLGGITTMPAPCANIDSAITVDLNWTTCGCTSGPIPLTGMFTDGGMANEQVVLLDPNNNVVDAVLREFPQETSSLINNNTLGGLCPAGSFDLDLMPITYERIGESAGRGNSFGRKLDGDCGWLKTPPQSANAPNDTHDNTPSLNAQLQIIKSTNCLGIGGSVSVSFNGPSAGSVFPLKYILALDKDSNNVFNLVDTYINGADITPSTLDLNNLAVGHYKLVIMPGTGCNYKTLEFYILPCGSVVLPVTIADLAVSCKLESRQVSWKSNQSDQIAYFEVESTTMSEPYKSIGKIYPVSTGNTLQQFTFNDKEANRIQLLYRIKIVAKNGSVVYSNSTGCNVKPNSAIVIYPNPVKGEVKIQLNSNYKETADVYILTSDSRTVKNTSISIKKGLNEISIPVSELLAGSYVIRFFTNQQMISFKFIKN